ncbi:hypothetical protein ED388_12970 [Muribaculaceae bacterium Isolate-007 (NCI)]|nr:hypothetical protein ED388_12970 [Muribaculaceae bacterium Isolate-007 (NCI)]
MEPKKASLLSQAACHSVRVPVVITASTFFVSRESMPSAWRRVAGKSSKLKTPSSGMVIRPAARAISSQAVL